VERVRPAAGPAGLVGIRQCTGIEAVFLRLGQIAPVVLLVLAALLFLILLSSNRRLAAESSKIDASPQP